MPARCLNAIRSFSVCAALLLPAVASAQGIRGAPAPVIQVPKCAVEVTGFNNGPVDVKVMTVKVVELGQTSSLSIAAGAFIFAPGGVKVIRVASRLNKCEEGTAEITLELQSTPKKTHVYRAPLTPTRTTVELGEVKRFF